MSVNDDLPWIAAELALIRDAVERGVPVLGHCLGGQLLARALGATVGPNPVKEIGWGEVEVVDPDAAAAWLPGLSTFPAFHWHGETFTLPDGARPLLASAHCARQGFVLGPHLGLQCHVEMTSAMIEEWCRLGADELAAAAASPGVQTWGCGESRSSCECGIYAPHGVPPLREGTHVMGRMNNLG